MANATNRLNVFPVFFKVADKLAIVVGNGAEAMAKARLLGESSIRVRLVSRDPSPELASYALQAGLEHVRSDFDPALLAGAIIVFAATGDVDLDFEIVSAARSLNIPANAVDRPEICDFYTPAIVNRAPIAVAIGSEGTGPVLTQMIRSRVEAILPRSTGSLARLAALYRVAVDHLVPRGVSRRRFWQSFFGGEVARLVEKGEMPAARRAATRLLKGTRPEEARAVVVPVCPGEPDLLTLRAVRAMQEADAIVFFAGTDPALVAMGRRDAERVEIPSQASIQELALVVAAHARGGHQVSVLTDSTASSHAEIAVELKSHGISTTILPGVAEDDAIRIRSNIAA